MLRHLELVVGYSAGQRRRRPARPQPPHCYPRPRAPYSVRTNAGVSLSPELRAALDKFVGEHKVAVFMKGTREAPQCGFSNTVVQVLRGAGAGGWGLREGCSNAVVEVRQGWGRRAARGVVTLKPRCTGVLPVAAVDTAAADRVADAVRSILTMHTKRTRAQILNSLSAQYETVNVLDNELIRTGMKEYSAWPTFPQVSGGRRRLMQFWPGVQCHGQPSLPAGGCRP